MRVIVATNNAGKIAELRGLLPADVELLTLAEAGLDSPKETGTTFAENALLKARHAAPHAELLRRLAELDLTRRSARFVSAAAFVSRDGNERVAEGAVHGVVIDTPRGANGFGYDPLFEIHDLAAPSFNGRTMAELTIDEKNAISHRGRAVRALITDLRAHGLLAQRD